MSTGTAGGRLLTRTGNTWRAVKRVLEKYGKQLITLEAIAFYVFLYLPILVVIVTSFNDAQIAIAWRGSRRSGTNCFSVDRAPGW
ncbi:hypothetical protein ACFQH6_12015 [Halobacteriaceae archaeon GCM10025711]